MIFLSIGLGRRARVGEGISHSIYSVGLTNTLMSLYTALLWNYTGRFPLELNR